MSKPIGIFFSNHVVFSENLNFKAQAKAVKSQAEAKKLQVIVHSSSLDCFHIHQDHWKKEKNLSQLVFLLMFNYENCFL